jgi:hypothetical protein
MYSSRYGQFLRRTHVKLSLCPLTFHKNDHPCALLRVCQRWRSIVLGMPLIFYQGPQNKSTYLMDRPQGPRAKRTNRMEPVVARRPYRQYREQGSSYIRAFDIETRTRYALDTKSRDEDRSSPVVSRGVSQDSSGLHVEETLIVSETCA